ncbi:hypothetical protein NKI31_13420 [Mesorhizobium sp. M0659]|uniref:hypothetical protein n=1 Tax=Mesorhizobium sp. M0659 TaxID=2956980 RepID=UPI00333B16EB
MDQAVFRPASTAKQLVDAVIRPILVGSIVSVRDTVAAVRKADPDLQMTDCELVETIMDQATLHGQFVLFDLREESPDAPRLFPLSGHN